MKRYIGADLGTSSLKLLLVNENGTIVTRSGQSFHAFLLGMDSFALGLINAAKLIEDGRLEENLKNRYASFSEGIGKTILDGTADLCSLADHAAKCQIGQRLPRGKRKSGSIAERSEPRAFRLI